NQQVIEIKDNNFDGNNGLEKDVTNELEKDATNELEKDVTNDDTSSNILNIPFISRRKKSFDIEHSNITPGSVSPSSLSIQKKKSRSSKGSFDSNIVKQESELPSTSKEVIILESDDDNVNDSFTAAPHVTPAIRQGCIYSLIIGSNIGACLTIVGALAGLM
ncbi:5260_t:CDS:2, partial [Racocetra fulgida]